MNFRIDFGYQYLYSGVDYHPQYLWDGNLECINGEILEICKLEYPENNWFGPGLSPKEIKLDSPYWELRTRKGTCGIKVNANTGNNTLFILKTSTINIEFSAEDLIKKGRMEFPVGPKYLACYVTITMEGYYWFRSQKNDGSVYLEVEDLPLQTHDWARMRLAWLAPQEIVSWEVEIEEKEKDVEQLLIQLIAMAVPEYTPNGETQIEARIPMELFCDDICVLEFDRFYRFHDGCMQLLEDDWQRIAITPGRHKLGIRNKHQTACLGISRIVVKKCGFDHMQLSIPDWSLANETIFGKIFAAWEDTIIVYVQEQKLYIDCIPGWNEFQFQIAYEGIHEVQTDRDRKMIEIYEVKQENPPVKVGYDMTVVPHDDTGFMDWLLDYTQRTKLGNYVVFRSFLGKPADSSLERWGEYCKNHEIYIAANKYPDFENGVLAKAGGTMFHDCGKHEYTGKVYLSNPTKPYASDDMKIASEKFIEYLKQEIDLYHRICDCAAFGDASGSARYTFLAGADFIRAETMVSNTMPFLAQIRPAAESLGKGRWGVHIAIQHLATPYRENHLGQYFLSLFQPWMMGAEAIYEEDSLFCMFKEERQAWDDALTKGKRDMTRKFYKFVKTHPRVGKNTRNIAFLEGKYAAPFNGFICGFDQTPHYSVWGMWGNESEQWWHLQPEKSRQLLDVLMPGASTQPLRQKHQKRRFFFAGTPYGDFDCTPIESSADYLKQYKLLLNLGWNTMLMEDYEKLKSYVEAGGVLLTGLPQFSAHTKRDFLKDMEDLALIKDGDLRDLCGVKVLGKGERFSGTWNSEDKESLAKPELSAAPNDCVSEDGDAFLANVELKDAELLAWDGENGKPLLVRNKVGNGFVYTFTIWAYPGHELFQMFCASWVQWLSKQACESDGCFVTDSTGEIFWTVWNDKNVTQFMLLNTDWTNKGNIKDATVHYKGKHISLKIEERTAVIVVCNNKEQMDVYTYRLD